MPTEHLVILDGQEDIADGVVQPILVRALEPAGQFRSQDPQGHVVLLDALHEPLDLLRSSHIKRIDSAELKWRLLHEVNIRLHAAVGTMDATAPVFQ